MASICQRCALRLQRAAQSDVRLGLSRPFSSTAPTSQKSIPKFEESTNPELNDILSTIRQYHFIPSYLKKHERRMILSDKFKSYLEENDVGVKLAGSDEEIPLQWLGTDPSSRPPFRPLIKRATTLILNSPSEDTAAFSNLVPLLKGTHEGMGKPRHPGVPERIIRKTAEAGRMEVVVRILRRGEETGVTLRDEEVRRHVLAGLRLQGQKEGWEEGNLEMALRNAQGVMMILEAEEFGPSGAGDPKTRPETVAVFLELAAVYAWKYQGGKDVHGLVKTYAERLLKALEGREIQVELLQGVPQWSLLSAIPIWHGLHLALKIVGDDLSNAALAQSTVSNLGGVLSRLGDELTSRNPAPETYDHQALEAWQTCIRD